MQVLELVAGAVIVLLVIADVFLTVLYARIGAGILSMRIARATWWVVSRIARLFRSHHDKVLSFCGPIILVNLLVVWALLLTLGAALIIHPALGRSVTAASDIADGADAVTPLGRAGSGAAATASESACAAASTES